MSKFKCTSNDESTTSTKGWSSNFEVGGVYDEGELMPGFDWLQEEVTKNGKSYFAKPDGFDYAQIVPKSHFVKIEE